MSKDVSKTKTPGTQVMRWEDQLAKDSQLAMAVEQGVGVGNYIGTRGGRLSVAGSPVKDNKFKCVIVDHLAVNAFYLGKFDPQNPQSPVCYAFGHVRPDGTMPDMVPHEKAPNHQSEACTGCPKNAFKSDDRGKGKACKNIRRLALIHADHLSSAEAARKAPIMYLNVPVTSVGGWANYVRNLGGVMKRPPYAVITEVELQQDDKVQWRMLFNLIEKVTDQKMLKELYDLHVKVEQDLQQPYPENVEAVKAKSAGQRGKVSKGRR